MRRLAVPRCGEVGELLVGVVEFEFVGEGWP